MIKVLYYIACFLLGASISICVNQYFKLKKMKECISNDICVNYYREYKMFDTHESKTMCNEMYDYVSNSTPDLTYELEKNCED